MSEKHTNTLWWCKYKSDCFSQVHPKMKIQSVSAHVGWSLLVQQFGGPCHLSRFSQCSGWIQDKLLLLLRGTTSPCLSQIYCYICMTPPPFHMRISRRWTVQTLAALQKITQWPRSKLPLSQQQLHVCSMSPLKTQSAASFLDILYISSLHAAKTCLLEPD